jgi:hypothetical protein
LKKKILSLALLLSPFIITLTECNVQADTKTKIHTAVTTTNQTRISLFKNDSLPLLNKIVVVIGENTSAASVIGNGKDAPYINSLIQNGANFTKSYALLHPSQPNYLALFSGNEQGVRDNLKPPKHFTTPNLARELINAGKNFICYSEDLPAVGFDGDVSGLYVRKHNPVANWMGTKKNQVPAATNQPFTAFPSDFSSLPDVSFVIPNICNDGHNLCLPYNNSIKQFDSWIQDHLDAYKSWCINNNSILIVTYDEDDYTDNNRILTVFYGDHVKTGDYNEKINLYNILRTIEDRMGLTVHAGHAATAAPITYCWSF